MDCKNSGKKKVHKDQRIWSGDRKGGVGVFYATRWGSKSSVPPSKFVTFETRENKLCPWGGGGGGNFAGMSRPPGGGAQKVRAKKSSAPQTESVAWSLVWRKRSAVPRA